MASDEPVSLTRRAVVAGGLSVVLPVSLSVPVAVAQTAKPGTHLQELNALLDTAESAGVKLPPTRRAASREANEYNELMPRVVDLIERAGNSPDGDALAEQAAELLSRINRAERGEQPAGDGKRRAPPSLKDLEKGYVEKFGSCSIAPPRQKTVDVNVALLTRFQPRYEKVSELVGVPWYFVGIIHGLEASFNFRGHLHNGDYPLRDRTRHVPANRPKIWNPPNDWESSAVDALRMKGFDKEKEWQVPHLLYRWELYNGFGYQFRRVNSPYLWSFTNHYTKGKYVSDGSWSSTAVSKQAGAVSMLKQLVTSGKVKLA